MFPTSATHSRTGSAEEGVPGPSSLGTLLPARICSRPESAWPHRGSEKCPRLPRAAEEIPAAERTRQQQWNEFEDIAGWWKVRDSSWLVQVQVPGKRP